MVQKTRSRRAKQPHDAAPIANQLPVSAVNVDQIGSSDSVQFSEHKIRNITTHSLTQEAWDARIIHALKDRISAIYLDDYYRTYCLVSASAAYLDSFSIATGEKVP